MIEYMIDMNYLIKTIKKKKQLHELFRNNLTTYTKSRASNEQIAVYSLSKKKKKKAVYINKLK